MRTRKLGNELTVSAIGLGCMGMSFAYGEADERQSIRTLHRAIELGVIFFDTAEVYGPYENEKLLGRALKDRRDQVVIATKFGFLIEPGKPAAEAIKGVDGRPENAKAVAEASLKRLDTDVIDLYYQHRIDPNVPIEESVGAMAELVKEGKVRAIGLSEASATTIRRAHAVHPIAAVQSEYSLWTRDPEDEVLATCRELGIGFVPYSPLGRGMLTGTIRKVEDLADDDFRRSLPRFQVENFDANAALVEKLQRLAAEKQVTAAQLALAWGVNQGDNIVPIPGARKLEHLEQNAAAADIVLSAEERAELGEALSPTLVAGSRYTEASLALTNR
ncbi:aryl-alcohol dehydrogenase-like predicted oxidoreductase [Sinorhizobium fredii]|jgi:aryl-alcohol dehydrogenase-like predicted oxidoreductase|uniref:Putative oxidoreductase YccK n=1 Tax=Sinorhizobium fredii (strain USDA 257) TaxID=1185652 RepID=I3XFI0_SINF2|nr:aldo/keto reductase [Sinorhizobium fredii]AFL54636.1 putative oxidoreductase YccK [Sinorhizobium fredii USDA 257]